MPSHLSVTDAAQELGLSPSRVRALIESGALAAEKVGGRWLVPWESVVTRRRDPMPPGRPVAPRNAWILLLEATDELPADASVDPSTRWRLRKALEHQGLVDIRHRLERRAATHRLWGLPGELRRLRTAREIVLTGSSAAGALDLELAAPDTVDAYVNSRDAARVIAAHDLEDADHAQHNVVLRVVPEAAWLLDMRQIAPYAAVGLDLASYADARSSHVGMEMLHRLDREHRVTGTAR